MYLSDWQDKEKRTAGGELQKQFAVAVFSCSVLIEGGRMMNEEMNNSYYGNNTQGNPNPVPQPEPGKPSGYSIASMVLGICSIVTCCLYGVPGIICGIIACIFAKKENDLGHANSFTKAGMICGIIGIILSALMLIYLVVVVMLSLIHI